MSRYKFYIFLITTIFSTQTHAEIYKDFLPTDSLVTIKNKYPNANLTDIKAAWVQENESFISLTGVGITGTIYLKFSTLDPIYKILLQSNQDEIDQNPTSDNSKNEARIKLLNEYTNLPLDQKLTLDWLRWGSPNPLPFERITSKYGKPEKCDFDPDTFTPYCAWKSKGVLVNLSDDKKYVYSIEYSFTDADRGSVNATTTNVSPEKDSKTKPSNRSKTKKVYN